MLSGVGVEQMSPMTSLDWLVMKAVLERLSIALAVIAWIAVVVLAWREPRATEWGGWAGATSHDYRPWLD
jgi:hypothetical protein